MSDELHQQIVAELGETAPGPSAQIEQIIQRLGPERARDLLAETHRVEASGGLWLERLNRRRSPGGVFLFLARQSCDDQTLVELFNERRLPDGSFERLPKPKENYAFGGDWPNMTPEAYVRLCAAGFSVNFPRLDIVRAFWVAQGEPTLLALAQQARAEKEKTKRRTFSDIFLTLAYAQLPADVAAQLPPMNVPEARYGRVERKKMAQAGNRAVAERRPAYEASPAPRAVPPAPRIVSPTPQAVRPAPRTVSPAPQVVRSAPVAVPPPPAAPPAPEDPTLNIGDEKLRAVALGAGVLKSLKAEQVEILSAAYQALGPERLAQLAAQVQADLRTGGVVAQNGERLTAPETILVYQAYARLNRAQRKTLAAPQGWMG